MAKAQLLAFEAVLEDVIDDGSMTICERVVVGTIVVVGIIVVIGITVIVGTKNKLL